MALGPSLAETLSSLSASRHLQEPSEAGRERRGRLDEGGAGAEVSMLAPDLPPYTPTINNFRNTQPPAQSCYVDKNKLKEDDSRYFESSEFFRRGWCSDEWQAKHTCLGLSGLG